MTKRSHGLFCKGNFTEFGENLSVGTSQPVESVVNAGVVIIKESLMVSMIFEDLSEASNNLHFDSYLYCDGFKMNKNSYNY